MTSFTGRNQELFQRNVIDEYKKEMETYRYFNIVGLFGLVLIIPSVLWLIDTNKEYNESFQMAMLACIFSGTMLTVPLLRLSSMYHIKKAYKMSIHKKNVEIRVEDDLTFKVYENGEYCYHILQIEKIFGESRSYTMCIKGSIKGTKYGSVKEYEFSRTLCNNNELITYLYLNQHICNQKKYQNNTLKKVMHADENTRKKLFLQTLKDSYFFVPATLSRQEIPDSIIININETISLTVQTIEGKVCLYTSKEEIPKVITKQFPIFFVYSLLEIVECLSQSQTFIFTTNADKTTGIIINPNDEYVELTKKQVEEIFS